MFSAKRSVASRAVRRLLRHRVGVVWLCLIALTWCQFSAVANGFALCGADIHGGHAVAMADTHSPGNAEVDCPDSGCPVAQSLKHSTPDPTANLLPLIPERHALVLWVGSTGISTLRILAQPPRHPPPHFLGQLLI